jgi:integrase
LPVGFSQSKASVRAIVSNVVLEAAPVRRTPGKPISTPFEQFFVWAAGRTISRESVQGARLRHLARGNEILAVHHQSTPGGNPHSIRGMRDRALLAVLVTWALRRGELSRMNCGHLAMRDGRWVFLDFKGKGNKVRCRV